MLLINALNHTHGAMFCGNEGTEISNFLPESQPSRSMVRQRPGWLGARVGGSQPRHREPAGKVTRDKPRGEETGLARGDSACRATSPRDPVSSAEEGAGWQGGDGEARSRGLKGRAVALGSSGLTLCPEDRHSPAL